ncbi:hypothetical protein [Embleya sp. NPDC059237]|uniref:hypothetical protein n=1 Tax=Embleya sp. NPDC059237 TaxID=3346784 RepID=UPI0036741614
MGRTGTAGPTSRDQRPWLTGVPAAELAATTFPKLVVTGGGTPGFEDVADALAEQLSAKRVLFDGSPQRYSASGSRSTLNSWLT